MSKLNASIIIACIPLYLLGMQNGEPTNIIRHNQQRSEDAVIQFSTCNVNIDPLGKSFRKQLLKTTQSSTPSWPQIDGLIATLKNPNFANNKTANRVFLLHGPPGNGKTTLAKAIAQEAQVPYILERGANIGSIWINSGEQYLASLVEFVKSQEKVYVVIIDEVNDLLAKKINPREKTPTSNCFSSFLDYAVTSKYICVICTTNTSENCSKSTISKFVNTAIEIPQVTDHQKEIIIRYCLAEESLIVSDNYIKNWAREIIDLTPREIQAIISQAKSLLETNHATNIEQSLSLARSFSSKAKAFFYDSKKSKWKTGRIIVALSLTGSILYIIYKFVERYDVSAKESHQQTIELKKLDIELEKVKIEGTISILTTETRKIVEQRLLQESQNEATRIEQNGEKIAAEIYALKKGADATMKNAENTAGAFIRDVAETVREDFSKPILESTAKKIGAVVAGTSAVVVVKGIAAGAIGCVIS